MACCHVAPLIQNAVADGESVAAGSGDALMAACAARMDAAWKSTAAVFSTSTACADTDRLAAVLGAYSCGHVSVPEAHPTHGLDPVGRRA